MFDPNAPFQRVGVPTGQGARNPEETAGFDPTQPFERVGVPTGQGAQRPSRRRQPSARPIFDIQEPAELSAELAAGRVQPAETGAPSGVRALVGGVSDPEARLSTLQQFFPTAAQDPVSGRLVFIDPKSGEAQFYNPEGLDVGDVASLAREGAQAAGGAVGAALGLSGGPAGVATVPAGAALGTAAGEELFNLVGRTLGMQDPRTMGQRATETGIIGATGGLGQAAGSAIGAAIRGAPRSVARGTGEGAAEGVQEAVQDLARFDVTPSVAQATKNQFLDGVESLLSRTPGGAGRFRKVVTDTTQRIADSLEGKVTTLTGRTAVDPEFVGRVVQRGIDDPLGSGFVQRFQNTAGELYNRIGINPDQQVSVQNTRSALEALNLVPDVPSVNALVTSPTVRGLGTELPETLTYEALSRVRSAVGRRLANPSLVSDVPRADLKRLYAGISADMEEAARQAGPQAERAFKRANQFYSAGSQRIEDTLESLASKATPEEIFLALERGGKRGPTQIRTVMRSLKPGEREILAGGIIRRLGNPTPGQAGAEGAQFSFETFLTNWNRLDNAAKRAMLDWPQMRGMRNDLEALARASERVRESSRAFANPSGTAGATAGQTATFLGGGSAAAGAGMAALGIPGATGFLAFPAVLALGALTSNAGARLMTSPKVVRWLAQSTKIKPGGFAGHLGRLGSIAATAEPETRQAILEYMNQFNRGQ